MEVLTKDEVLYHRGSLLTADGVMVASWDLEQQESFSGDYFSLAGYRGIRNAAAAPSAWIIVTNLSCTSLMAWA